MQNSLRAVCLLLALLISPGGVEAQMPGGRSVDVARLRGDFYSQMTSKVREVMDSWQATWRGVGKEPLFRLYGKDATLVQPGGSAIQGRDQIRRFSESVLPFTSGLRSGMQNLEAVEGMAYLSGYYAVDPVRPDRAPSTGRHFTIIMLEGGDWVIRNQFFLPDSGTAGFPGLVEAEFLEPLTNSRVRSGPRGPSRFMAFGDAEYVLMAFRDAWARGDAADAASFFEPGAWVRFPNETPNSPRDQSLEERLKEGISHFKDLLSVEVDFDRRDRLSFTLGRYHALGVDRSDASGHFLMVLRYDGSAWLIRSLVFS